jgi:glycosyltransferase involved in cell wall biosynthesis
MRFIYHHRTSGRGGEGVHISSVVRALRESGHEVTVVSPPGVDPMSSAAAVPLDKGAKDVSGISRLWKWISCSCPQVLFEIIELLYNLYAVVRLPFVLWRAQQPVYYERYAFFLSAGVWIAKMMGVPVILEVNEVTGTSRARPLVCVGMARWLERRTFSRADEIGTVSSYLQAEVLKRGGREGHVHLIPNAIDPERFQMARGDRIRERLGLAGARVIGFVGWFDKWDRLGRLITLMKELHPAHAGARLLLVGDGPAVRDLSAQIEKDGVESLVVLSGPVARADVPDYIAAMDICVLPDSNVFGSPIVLFEFMASGKPVIAPDLAPIRDVIDDGTTGWIVNPADAKTLRAAVERLLNDPVLAARVGVAAKRRVLEQHTWSAVGRRIEQLAVAHLERRAADGAPTVEVL